MKQSEDADAVERFITEVKWRFAKTMAKWPLWYVMEDWNPGREPEFRELVRRIFEQGRNEQWGVGKWERTVRYYYAGPTSIGSWTPPSKRPTCSTEHESTEKARRMVSNAELTSEADISFWVAEQCCQRV
jgi:hypothetical protein